MVEFSCEGLAKKKQKTKKTLYEKIIIKKEKKRFECLYAMAY